MRITFNSDLDSIQENIILYDTEDLYKYSSFRINIETDDEIYFYFFSDVYTTSLSEIETFVNKFLQNEVARVSFNSNSGSLISYLPHKNLLLFNVFTWKEGTTTGLDFSVKLNSTERHNLFSELFMKLLNFRRAFENIEVREEPSDIENYSDEEEQPDDENSTNIIRVPRSDF